MEFAHQFTMSDEQKYLAVVSLARHFPINTVVSWLEGKKQVYGWVVGYDDIENTFREPILIIKGFDGGEYKIHPNNTVTSICVVK